MLLIHCYASPPHPCASHRPTVHYLFRKTPASSPIISATFPHPSSSSSSSTRRTLSVSIATTTISSLILSFYSYSSTPSKSAINTDFFDLPNSGGVKALDLRTGTGATPVDGDQVGIHYYGRLGAKQGWRFDSTYDHKDGAGEPIPFVFTLGSGKVISGIEAAVRSMKVGGTRRVIIPPSQGYQNTSQEPIPPNEMTVEIAGYSDIETYVHLRDSLVKELGLNFFHDFQNVFSKMKFFDRQRLFTTIFNPTRLANGEGSTLGTLIFDIELISPRHL